MRTFIQIRINTEQQLANKIQPHDFNTPRKSFIQAKNINGEESQHNKSKSDVQLKHKLNSVVSKKVNKLNQEK